MMQETLLRVFVVTLSLLMYPRDDPGVEEWDDVNIVGLGKHEERLLRGEEELDHKMAPFNQEVTHTDNENAQDDLRNIPVEQNLPDQRLSEEYEMLEDVSEENAADHKPQGEHFIANSDPSQPSNSEPETALKSTQTDHEQMREDIQTGGSLRDASRAQGQQERYEEKEVHNTQEQGTPLSHLYTDTSENEISERALADWDKDYLCYIWNTFSIISLIRFVKKYLGRTSQMEQETSPFSVMCTAGEVPLPGSHTLQQFHSKWIKMSSDKKWRKEEFLEGFANDLLDAMRTVCDRNGSTLLEDFYIVDMCNIIIPFSPCEPYSFQCLLWNNQASELLPDMQVCGQVKLVENKENCCHCQSSGTDDMVCLLHCETEKAKTKSDATPLCMKNSPFVSKLQVTRWFQGTIKQAWALISHKYEFELNIRHIEAPGALVIRFRSGKKISFSMNPVIKVNADAHLFIAPSSANLETFWTLSLTNYEDCFLELITKCLPESSCHRQALEIANFLHKRQTALSGSCALKDFHFKTALMHLLLTKDTILWKPNHLAFRLRDLLEFMGESLEKKLLHHALVGNPLSQKVIQLPAEFTDAKPVNLFHPLVVHDCIYRNAVMHFQEMLRNANMLIHDYADQC